MRRSRLYVPLASTIVLFAVYFFVTRTKDANVVGTIDKVDLRYLLLAAIIALIVTAVRLLDFIAFDTFTSRRGVAAPLLLRQIVSIVFYTVLIAAAISQVLGKPMIAFLTTTTVVAAVIGLALQDTLGNLFSGISLHMENTFGVGDVIRSGEFIGVVEGLNWRATRIRTFNDNTVVLPNSVIARERLEVFSADAMNARTVSVGVAYDVPPEKVIAVLQNAARSVDGVASEVPCIARVISFGDSAVNYEVKYWTKQYRRRDAIDAEIRKAIWYALKRSGMTIPFPIRSLTRIAAPYVDSAEGSSAEVRLAEVEILAPLSNDERSRIAAAAAVRTFGRGETILRAGAAGNSMFVIDSGRVSVRIPVEGEIREVAQLDPGSIFGEMALLTGESRTADIVALDETTVIEIGKESLGPVLSANPELAEAISAKVVERRIELDAHTSRDTYAEHGTLLVRIRSWFGLR